MVAPGAALDNVMGAIDVAVGAVRTTPLAQAPPGRAGEYCRPPPPPLRQAGRPVRRPLGR